MALKDLILKILGEWKKDGTNRITGTFYDPNGYDQSGYNREGFNAAGYNRSGFDIDGFNIDGYDKYGYNRKGYNRAGYNRHGFNEKGYNKDGYDANGLDINGFDEAGIHKDTGEPYDPRGFNREGLNPYGFDRSGIHAGTKTTLEPYGFDRYAIHDKTGTHHDPNDFAINGINRKTKTAHDKNGFDRDGKHNRTGKNVNEHGFNRDGVHQKTGRKYDPDGFDIDGIHEVTHNEYDKNGFNRNAIHKETRGFTDPFGFDKRGINRKTGKTTDEMGFDFEGYNRYGFNRQGIHKITGTSRDKAGFDINGIHKKTNDRYDENLFNRDGIHKITGTKYSKYGFNAEGLHKNTKSKYNEEGFDNRGIHRATHKPHDKNGFDIDGNHFITKTAWDEQGFDKYGYTAGGFNRKGIHRETQTPFDKNGFDINGKRKEVSKEDLAHYRKNREQRKKTPTEPLLFLIAPEKYNERVQNYKFSFSPEKIKNAKSYVMNKQGLPFGSSGNNAVVYCFNNSHKLAVRCFYHLYPSQKKKYEKLREFIKKNALEFLLDFDYYENGVLIDGKWLPITVLPWSDGLPITNYLQGIYDDKKKIRKLTDNFLSISDTMHNKGVAHGDLQHGNILIEPSEKIKLIDYDNFYIEELIDCTSPELGHKNYQHPKRDRYDYDRYMDHFSEWVIVISLKALAIKPELWKLLNGNDERLLFVGEDYLKIEKSSMYKELLRIKDDNLTSLVKYFAEITKLQNLYEIPSVLGFVDSVKQVDGIGSANGKVKHKPVKDDRAKEKPVEGTKQKKRGAGNVQKQSTAGNMVEVKGGAFQMGNTRNDREGKDTEKPVHTVNLMYDYWIGKYVVTFNEYDAYCETTRKTRAKDEGWGRGTRPVINVSWIDAIKYCNWLSEQKGLPKAYDSDGNLLDRNGNKTTDIRQVAGYRLPTEAEWEYAARGGHKDITKGEENNDCKYAGSNSINDAGWYKTNSRSKTHLVGRKKANELGIYDISGNVWEWCHDWYGEYSSGTQTSLTGPSSGASRVIRGGGWGNSAQDCRVASRCYFTPLGSYYGLGFRLARTIF